MILTPRFGLNSIPLLIQTNGEMFLDFVSWCLACPFLMNKSKEMFSMMKVIKTERRNCLQTGTLCGLLEIQLEVPSLTNFSPEKAVKIWWDDCKTTGRVNQRPRKDYQCRRSSSSEPNSTDDQETSTDDTQSLSLDDWDSCFEYHSYTDLFSLKHKC